ncbi:MAG: LamG-like jellyroll fold domain-containing protein, partial [Planctomycetota bacterium]
AVVVNDGAADAEVTASLVLPPGLRLLAPAAPTPIPIAATDGEHRLQFVVEATAGGPAEIGLELAAPGMAAVRRPLTVNFLPPLAVEKLDAVPPPQPVATDMLVGAIHCPLWEADRVDLWRGVLRHPERLPALGLYAQEQPQVAEWEAKWALEHGISFFVYCWYRAGQGGAVRTRFGRGLEDGLFKSRVAETMRFAILWENQAQGVGGVAGERDLLDNVVPYWIETFFKRPNYLTIDGQPVLFIYETESFIRDLGGMEPAVRAVAAMRAACRAAGFSGLTLLGEHRGFVPATLERMRDLGVDASFAYCWYLPGSPDPDAAVAGQLAAIRGVRDRGVLPQVVTVSQGWSGWHDEGTVWSVPPDRFERLLREAKAIATASPPGSLESRMILLDNWNEWSEGHFIAPARQHGFGYLDAVRRVFATAPDDHVDLLPEDVGLGPYDAAARLALARREELRPLLTRRLTAERPAADLVGWWTFDEPADTPVACDASGHRLGGELLGVARVPGLVASAIACGEGVVVVPDAPLLSVPEAITIDCWVKTDVPGQHDRWLVNRVQGGGTDTGYRLGLLEGKPCFEVPQTAWSHHLTAPEPLPLGRWVHLAGTFDGHTMRLYVDGAEVATLDRPGPIHRSHFELVLGGFAPGHRSRFQGLLDEVRLFSRALSADEIRARHDAQAAPGTAGERGTGPQRGHSR